MARLVHLAQNASKGGDGESWNNALTLGDVTSRIASAQPDDEILIGFSRDRETPWFWKETVGRLTTSGLPNRPIRISFGYVGGAGTVVPPTPSNGWAFLRRAGAQWPKRGEPDLAGDPFLTITAASQVQISGPLANGAPANGLISLAGSIDRLTIRDLHLAHGGRAVETIEDSRLTRLIIENCSGYGLGRGFARFHFLADSTLRDLVLDAADTDGGGEQVVQLISVIAGENLVFENITFRHGASSINASDRGSRFVQGDGMVLEEDTKNAQISGCHARDMGDAGFDLKCDGVQMADSSARGCKFGVRIWRGLSENRLSRVSIAAPRSRNDNAGACLWVGGTVTLSDCLLSGADEAAVIRFGKGTDGDTRSITLIGGTVETAGGAFLAGEPGEMIMRDVRVDGRKMTGRAIWDGQEIRFE